MVHERLGDGASPFAVEKRLKRVFVPFFLAVEKGISDCSVNVVLFLQFVINLFRTPPTPTPTEREVGR